MSHVKKNKNEFHIKMHHLHMRYASIRYIIIYRNSLI